MESINLFKGGYGRVTDLEEQPTRPKPIRRRPIVTAIAVSAVLLFTLVLAFMLAALIRESNSETGESESIHNSTESIQIVCGVTQHPNSCFSSISSLNGHAKPDPESILKLSLQVSSNELGKLSSVLKSLNDLHSGGALRDCASQIDDALSRLNDSMSAMQVNPGEKGLTEEKIKDIQTWISAGITDQETCVDGLEEMGSTVLDQVKAKMQKSTELLSNSLAIVANIQTLLQKFDLQLH
ncbi:pectinesterase 1 [Tripterygium wilfordii]|uniref:pectinesterase n=1 Tax=Tripterygium wilfordii TaxID=458696 RepID=A0A7J7C8R8_TRIWF|nr:pectinesterase 3 [Tripterygium wilfordii]KAF5730146.1 pectinesterase 1 [Tripterygium wilfordii]